MKKVIAACGNDCSVCPRYNVHPYEKTEEELKHTAELWEKIGYRDHFVTNEEISCTGCKPSNLCRFDVIGCCNKKRISNCSLCADYPCVNCLIIIIAKKKILSRTSHPAFYLHILL